MTFVARIVTAPLTTRVPQEFHDPTRPLAPMKCPECAKDGVMPEPILTCLGDFVLRIGGWCPSCRRFMCLLKMTHEIAARCPPWRFLTYDRRWPENEFMWPEPSRSFFDMSEFPFGANAKG